MAPVNPGPVTVKAASPDPHRSDRPRTVRLAGGVTVPYPEPVDAAATQVARGNRKRDTTPEVRLRSALQRRGLRFRKDHYLRLATVRVRPDVVFTRWKVAVFVDGCFWHSCPDHGRRPGRNLDYWIPKLDGNVARDRRVDAALDAEGWDVVRIWEHEDVETSAARVAGVVAHRRRA